MLREKKIDMTLSKTNTYLWDKNKVRYQLMHTNGNSQKVFNWLFFPGGPGLDSSYFSTLTPHLNLPGNTWYIDFPNNGSNLIQDKNLQDFNAWLDDFIPIILHFPNSIYVGHSFSGMLPLLYPELENYLTGLVIIASAPSLWFEASAKMAKKKNLPDLTNVTMRYMEHPDEKTFWQASQAFAHYYFLPTFLEKGLRLLKNTPANPYGPHWWMSKVQEIHYSAKWIPQKTPTLLIGGAEDAVIPFSLFLEDKRFHRSNIQLEEVKSAAHFVWIDDLECVYNLLKSFIKK